MLISQYHQLPWLNVIIWSWKGCRCRSSQFFKITDLINSIFKLSKIQRNRIRTNNILAFPFLCSNETWTVDVRNLQHDRCWDDILEIYHRIYVEKMQKEPRYFEWIKDWIFIDQNFEISTLTECRETLPKLMIRYWWFVTRNHRH